LAQQFVKDYPETIAAMNEYSQMKDHPEKYKRYASFRGVMSGNIAKQE